jgi:endogenous inhibitor of DNA gyrase (YacG/DUF329 family)
MDRARIKCPTCRRELDWHSAPFRPFCSERCRLIDLGAWLTEQRAIPVDSAAAPESAEAEEPRNKGAG